MSINYSTKVNERLIGQSITSESHTVGIVGVSTYMSGQIRLVEVPEGPAPHVIIPGYTETSGTPTGTLFLVDYDTGTITFDAAQNGNTVLASYTGLGSEIAAEDVNEVQDPLNSIATLNIVYNWPSAPSSITWTLANSIVTNSSVSSSAAIAYSKLNLNNSIVNADINASAGIVYSKLSLSNSIVNADINSSAAIVYSKLSLSNSILATDIATGQVVKSINTLTDAVTLTAGSNITITPSGNSLIFASTGGGGGAATSFQVLASDPGSPTTGEVWFNSTDFQFKGYNGTTVVLIG